MFSEDDLLPLSALQHLQFCERQCALIHIEGLWAENPLTLEGRHLHERVDQQGPAETRGDVRIARGAALRSLRLGLSGRADVVEFHRVTSISGSPPEISKGEEETWAPFPVEYKRGKPKRDRCDEVQLCAQALCLEEMLGVAIPRGALFYGKTRRRTLVEFDETLRRETEATAARLHELIASGVTPRAAREPKCERCSLLNLCLPEVNKPGRSASDYLRKAIQASEAADAGG